MFTEAGLLVGFFLPGDSLLMGQMEHRRFVFYNVAGGVAWVTSMTWTGYLLGQAVPSIGDPIHGVVAIVILLSLVPVPTELVRERRRRSA